MSWLWIKTGYLIIGFLWSCVGVLIESITGLLVGCSSPENVNDHCRV